MDRLAGAVREQARPLVELDLQALELAQQRVGRRHEAQLPVLVLEHHACTPNAQDAGDVLAELSHHRLELEVVQQRGRQRAEHLYEAVTIHGVVTPPRASSLSGVQRRRDLARAPG